MGPDQFTLEIGNIKMGRDHSGKLSTRKRSLFFACALVLLCSAVSYSQERPGQMGFHFGGNSLIPDSGFSARFGHYEELPLPSKLSAVSETLSVVYGSEEYGFLESRDFNWGFVQRCR